MSTNYTGLEIAVIGIAGRFPGADSIDDYWRNLKEGVESISFFNEEELLNSGEKESLINNPLYIRANGYISDKHYFDSRFFNFLPDEVKLMNPQTRLLHECVWKAIEDAGVKPKEVDSNIGLYVGASANIDWMIHANLLNDSNDIHKFSIQQLADVNFCSTQISHSLNLKGPSIFSNTACSTSLVNIHQACKSLLLSDCKIAIAGGISLSNNSKRGYLYQEGMIYSRDGHCRVFDKDASGTVEGEGVGIVVLRKLSDAIKNRDNIYAIIKGTGVNNDGKSKIGYTAPSVKGQAEVILRALSWAKTEPESIGYIETHGTGTILGDPVEIEALNLAFGKSEEKYCAIGSVKSNIGHLDVASGIAGFIKAVLALKYKKIPPSLNFKTPNPNIDFENSPFYVNTELREWKNDKYPLRAGVSSFGIGGTNAHVILEEAPQLNFSTSSRQFQILKFSGKTPAALKRNFENLKNFLEKNIDLSFPDVSYSLNIGRELFSYRKILICKDINSAIEQLTSTRLDGIYKFDSENTKSKIVFMFPGQGSQYKSMCLDLYENEQMFKKVMDNCFELILKNSGKDIKSILFDKNKNGIDDTEFTQPALFVVEYSLARLIMSWGINPDILIGHSIGEYVAACVCGVFSLEDALKLVVKRGELLQKLPRGKMLSVSISEADIRPFLAKHKNVSLAALNSSESCVVSGTEEAINSFKKNIELVGKESSILRTSHAFHSYMMDGILEEFDSVVKKVDFFLPKVPFISNLSGNLALDSEVTQSKYWVNHLRHTVNFNKGIEGICKENNLIFLEVGPGENLSSFVRANIFRKERHKVINLLGHPKYNKNADQYNLLIGIRDLALNGIELDWKNFYESEQRIKISLPTYSFDKISYPIENNIQDSILRQLSNPKLNINDITNWFYIPSWKLTPNLPEQRKNESVSCTLCLSDKFGIIESLSDKFKEDNEIVIWVRCGDSFYQESKYSYIINPNLDNDFHELVKCILSDNIVFQRIIHCWGITQDELGEITESSFLNSVNIYFYSLLRFIQLFDQYKYLENLVEVTVLTSGLHNIFGQLNNSNPIKSLVTSLLNDIGGEYPTITTAHVDISISEEINYSYLNNLYSELQFSQTQKMVSLRNSCRWVEILDPLKIKCQLPLNATFKKKENYLITGGLGEFGFIISQYLATNYDARVILLGRTKLPSRENWSLYLKDDNGDNRLKNKINKLIFLEEIGCDFLYISCDVSSIEEFSMVIQDFEYSFGNLCGVFHAAGFGNANLNTSLENITVYDLQSQLLAGINCLNVLVKVLGNRKLDFCLLTSSIASFFGKFGEASTSAGYFYMNNFIRTHKEKGLLKNWICVNLEEFGLDNPIFNSEDLIKVICMALSYKDLSSIFVSKSNIEDRMYGLEVDENIFSDSDLFENSLDDFINFPDEKISETEQSLIKLWQSFFGKKDITLNSDFFELGGDSLKAITLIRRIQNKYGVLIDVKDFYLKSNVREIAKELDMILLALNIQNKKQGTNVFKI